MNRVLLAGEWRVLTVVEEMGRNRDGEIVEEDLTYGVVTFSVGSVIALRSGRRRAIVGTRFENNR